MSELDDFTLHIESDDKKEDVMVINEYNLLVEELRKRLNILSTSIFLLSDSTLSEDLKHNKYLKKINSEMAKIRTLISSHPNQVG